MMHKNLYLFVCILLLLPMGVGAQENVVETTTLDVAKGDKATIIEEVGGVEKLESAAEKDAAPPPEISPVLDKSVESDVKVSKKVPQKPGDKKKASAEAFVPSEEISKDLSVSLPVDI